MITRRCTAAAAAAALLLTAATTLLAGGAAPAAAHSTIAWPRPSRNTDCTDVPGRRGPGLCTGRGNTACPRTRNPWEAGRNFRRAGAVLRRGQSVTLRYMKNNHGPVGFVRWSLVPAKLHYSVAAHARFAFWWNCWGSGYRRCQRRGDPRGCGSDRKKEAWSSRVTIPTSIPDGNYILGFGAWGAARSKKEGGCARAHAGWAGGIARVRAGRERAPPVQPTASMETGTNASDRLSTSPVPRCRMFFTVPSCVNPTTRWPLDRFLHCSLVWRGRRELWAPPLLRLLVLLLYHHSWRPADAVVDAPLRARHGPQRPQTPRRPLAAKKSVPVGRRPARRVRQGDARVQAAARHVYEAV